RAAKGLPHRGIFDKTADAGHQLSAVAAVVYQPRLSVLDGVGWAEAAALVAQDHGQAHVGSFAYRYRIGFGRRGMDVDIHRRIILGELIRLDEASEDDLSVGQSSGERFQRRLFPSGSD